MGYNVGHMSRGSQDWIPVKLEYLLLAIVNTDYLLLLLLLLLF